MSRTGNIQQIARQMAHQVAMPALLVATLLATAPVAASQASVLRRDEGPTAAAMVGDLVIARPIGAAMTVVGTAAFVVALPFTLLGGNTGEAAENLVAGPAKATFLRCLGCTQRSSDRRAARRN